MQREALERLWFVRGVTVLMVLAISVGAVPVMKNFMFPVEKIR